ncbi:MAG: hypothetical protein M1820_009639 [Bogoriella megaspora]|nr:MAG: hypothetical protein M1820_009639 [Bogoriella megaspora]
MFDPNFRRAGKNVSMTFDYGNAQVSFVGGTHRVSEHWYPASTSAKGPTQAANTDENEEVVTSEAAAATSREKLREERPFRETCIIEPGMWPRKEFERGSIGPSEWSPELRNALNSLISMAGNNRPLAKLKLKDAIRSRLKAATFRGLPEPRHRQGALLEDVEVAFRNLVKKGPSKGRQQRGSRHAQLRVAKARFRGKKVPLGPKAMHPQ